MGTFLSLSGIIGKTQNEVFTSLANYADSVGGGFQQETLDTDQGNSCVMEEVNGNTTILYPNHYLEWDDSSEFISKELKAPVFSCHIHDGDLWMYVLYYDGQIVDQFNPIPDYWSDKISDEEIQSWKGDAVTVAKYISNLKSKDIEKYLVRWDPGAEENLKAYPDDEFAREDWQLVDFINKLGLSYPIDDNRNPKGQTYKFWTKKLPLKSETETMPAQNVENKNKPWWKFW